MAENDKKLILVGGGGHCKAVIDVAVSAGRTVLGIIDNALPVGSKILNIPVIGGDDNIAKFADNDTEFLITVGQVKSSSIRHKLAEKILQANGTLSKPLVASTAHIADGTEIGRGTVIMHNAIINSDTTVGENCIINTGAIVEHDCRIGDFVHVSTGAIVNGVSSVGNDVFVGSHVTIANVKSVVSNTIIGAGAVVTNDITEPGTYCGVPAKQIRQQI